MSFGDNGPMATESGRIGECKPDYEAQAAAVKAKLDSTKLLEKALFDFAEKNSIYEFKNISSFAEMVGGVAIVKRQQALGYEGLLKKVEQNQ